MLAHGLPFPLKEDGGTLMHQCLELNDACGSVGVGAGYHYNVEAFYSHQDAEMKPDFMLYDSSNRLVLVAEVKATRNEDLEWAAKLRRNLTVHGTLPDAQFFLLVLPEHVYLWKDAPSAQQVNPNFVIDTKQLLKPYLAKFNGDTSHLSESGLELAVRSWLNDITSRSLRKNASADENKLLKESGLADRVQQGSLVYGDSL